MCYESDALPPVPADPTRAVIASPMALTSSDSAEFTAFLALPERPVGPGVVVLPDNRGLRGFYEQLCVRLAEHGHPAIAIDYFGRASGITQDTLYGDIQTAIDHLRGHCDSIVSWGFCLGGRLAFMTSASRFGLVGAIGFYGMPTIAGPYGPGPTEHAAELSAPILAVFGGADEGISPAVVAEFDEALTPAGVEHEFVVCPGAPHGFFDASNGEYAQASADAWTHILDFLSR